MNKELITDRQGISLMILFLIGSSIVIGSGSIAGRNSWISIIISFFAVIPILLIYSRILSLFPGNDLFDILNIVFGKVLGRFVNILYTWYFFHLGALVLANFGSYVKIVSFPETPKIFPILVLGFLCIWAVKNGIELLGRFGDIFSIIVIILLISAMILLIKDMDLNNLKPILSEGINPVLLGALNVFSFPFAETVIFMAVLSSLKSSKSPYRVYAVSILIGAIILLMVTISSLLVLGELDFISSMYPLNDTVRYLKIGNIFQRLEVISAVAFMAGIFIKASICLLSACKGLSKLFSLNDYRVLVTPFAALMINLSSFVYKSVFEQIEWAFKVWPYYSIPFQVILPIIILIASEIKSRHIDEKQLKTAG